MTGARDAGGAATEAERIQEAISVFRWPLRLRGLRVLDDTREAMATAYTRDRASALVILANAAQRASHRAARPGDAVAEEVARLRAEVEAMTNAYAAERARFQRLLLAFHDATRRTLGVTPASGDEFYDWRLAEAAEAQRPLIGTDPERRERPEVRLVAAQREKAAALGLLDGHASVVRQLEAQNARLRLGKDRFKSGVRAAVTWLHARAKGMTNPQATAILDSAATNLGWDLAAERVQDAAVQPEAGP